VGAADQSRWLSAQEQQTWIALLGLPSWLPDALDAQLQHDAGISHFEYLVMAMLSMSPQRTRRMSEVAALANGSLTRLSRTVDRLDKRGWVPPPRPRRRPLHPRRPHRLGLGQGRRHRARPRRGGAPRGLRPADHHPGAPPTGGRHPHHASETRAAPHDAAAQVHEAAVEHQVGDVTDHERMTDGPRVVAQGDRKARPSRTPERSVLPEMLCRPFTVLSGCTAASGRAPRSRSR
jgi:hypothetical protein